MTARVAIVTGANSGIGKETAVALGKKGYKVFLACRSEARAAPVLAEINDHASTEASAEFLALDLTSFESIRECVASFLAREIPLHALVNNAGIVARGTTQDGFELIFGVNHLGHFLLTHLLLDKLKASAPSRIVNVSSRSHYQAKSIDFEAVRQPTKSVSGLHEYEVSKVANVLFTRELARRLAGSNVTSYAVHPGQVATNVWRRVPWPIRSIMKAFMITSAEGARGVIRAASSAEAATEDGLYYDKIKPADPSALAKDDALAEELWQRSAAWTGLN